MLVLKSDSGGIWSARAFILTVAIVFAWQTWGRWGDIQIDCGREMYVPVEVLRGKLLYRDIWYQYGPLTPYVQALAFALFGINLNVLYVLGLILAISAALLLFEIGRNFQLVLPAAMAPALFFLAESFRPSIFNFIFPYSYAASMGVVFGLACLYFTVRHAISGRLRWLLLAALCTSLALLTKQEFGLACLGLLGFEAIAPCLNFCSWRAVIGNGLACVAGLLPTLLGYGYLVSKVSVKAIFIDNWVMTPGTYTMRTISHRTMAGEGIRFGVNEWSADALTAGVSLTLWFLISYANAFAIRRLAFSRLRSFVLLMGADIALTLLVIKFGSSVWGGLPGFIAQIVFPKGIFLISCVFTSVAIWKVWWTRGEAGNLAESALGIYAVLVGIRVMMEMFPGSPSYASFFNGPGFLVFVLVVARVIASGGQSLDVRRRQMLASCMLSTEVVLLTIGLFPRRHMLNTRLETGFGTIYTQADRAVLFPEIVSFMKTHTRNGRDIMVLPESPSLYFFSGMQSPTRWYEAQPGVLDPEQELELVNDAGSALVQYVLLCNRHVNEYGLAPFGIGYDRAIYKWLIANYIKVGQFGPRVDLLPSNTDFERYQPYVMEVYQKKSKN